MTDKTRRINAKDLFREVSRFIPTKALVELMDSEMYLVRDSFVRAVAGLKVSMNDCSREDALQVYHKISEALQGYESDEASFGEQAGPAIEIPREFTLTFSFVIERGGNDGKEE